MSALRKIAAQPPQSLTLTPAEQAFCREFIASVRLKPNHPRYWAHVQPQRKWDDHGRELSSLDPTIWGGSRGRC